jgi:hypothetical protein
MKYPSPFAKGHTMKRRYASFLIRCWLLEGGEQRVKIEHLQSGETTQFHAPVAAMDWLDLHWEELFRVKSVDQPSEEGRPG